MGGWGFIGQGFYGLGLVVWPWVDWRFMLFLSPVWPLAYFELTINGVTFYSFLCLFTLIELLILFPPTFYNKRYRTLSVDLENKLGCYLWLEKTIILCLGENGENGLNGEKASLICAILFAVNPLPLSPDFSLLILLSLLPFTFLTSSCVLICFLLIDVL